MSESELHSQPGGFHLHLGLVGFQSLKLVRIQELVGFILVDVGLEAIIHQSSPHQFPVRSAEVSPEAAALRFKRR